jgi:hypothetical protein
MKLPRKKCEVCGKFMNNALYGACMKCLRDIKRLPPELAELYDLANHTTGKLRSSIMGLVKALITIRLDGDWYAVKWDPMHIVTRNLETIEDRPHLTPSRIDAIHQLLKEAKDSGKTS